MRPPIPANEAERLKELYRYDILDTLPEQQFDDLALLASQVCHTPIALISLVDAQRQWFKSVTGLPVSETSRDVSFCAHAVASDRDLVVPDATKDARFVDNPLVTGEPNIRFYAGTLLKTPAGRNIGTLCVIDRRPHHMTDGEKKALEALGRQIVGQLELRLMVNEMKRTMSERERVEQSLAESEARYRILLGSMSDLIATLTLEGRFLYLNPAWQGRLGYNAEELDSMPIFDLVQTRQRADFELAWQHVKESKDLRMETVFVTRDGTEVDVEGNLNCRFEEGRPVSIQVTFRDVTERKAVEKLKEEFVSIVSHELRTPLTAILGSLGLVTGGVAGSLPDQALAMIEVAQKNSERLVLLINDILDIEKIESGKMQFDLRVVQLVPLIEECINDNSGYAEQLGVTFRIENSMPAEAGELHQVRVDPHRLCQVMANLLSNGAKFSPAGDEVLVQIEVAGTPDRPAVRVSVRDNGTGVPPEFQGRIFQKFAQADSSNTRQRGGTGLGLSICKAIIEQFHGRIDFSSEPGRGSTFFFELPAGARLEMAP